MPLACMKDKYSTILIDDFCKAMEECADFGKVATSIPTQPKTYLEIPSPAALVELIKLAIEILSRTPGYMFHRHMTGEILKKKRSRFCCERTAWSKATGTGYE